MVAAGFSLRSGEAQAKACGYLHPLQVYPISHVTETFCLPTSAAISEMIVSEIVTE